MAAKKGGPRDIFMGQIESWVVGLQYHHAPLRLGEEVFLEREPDNPHDTRAIRVDSPDFRTAGYLPRRDAAWLAPLMDQGKIFLEARIPSEGCITEQKAPLELRIFACSKGKDLLRPRNWCSTLGDGVTDLLFGAWQRAERWESAPALRELGQKLAGLVDRHSPPEAHLYLRLFQAQGKMVPRRTAEHWSAAWREIVPRESLKWKGCSVIFLSFSKGEPPEPGEESLLLHSALEQNLAEVGELSAEGSVPELKAVNRASRPLLILEGEVLEGGKQHRVVQRTLYLLAKEERPLGVACVEQGRWNYAGPGFRAAPFAPPSLRQTAYQGEHSQHRVWDEVEETLCRNKIQSPTQSLLECYELQEKELEEWSRRFEPPSGAVGCLVFQENRMLGLDLVESPATFASLWSRLSRGYFLQCLQPGESIVASKEASSAEEVLKAVESNFHNLRQDPEEPRGYSFEGERFVGRGIFHRGVFRHLAVFPRKAAEEVSPEV